MKHSRMIKGYLLILFAAFFMTGRAQVAMTIYNRSSATIDSVIIQGTKPFTIGPITSGSQAAFFVSTDHANFHGIAPFYLSVHSRVLTKKLQWQKTGFIDTLYFFDHGLTLDDKEPARPERFFLYAFNATAGKIDTVFAPNNAVIQIREITPRSVEVALDHAKLEPDQPIYFKMGEKLVTANLRGSDINDWSVTTASLYIDNDSAVFGLSKSRTPFEFVIDFEVQGGLSAKDIEVKARHLLKTYVWAGGKQIRAVCDYRQFKSDPQFKVKVLRKTHVITMTDREIDQADYQLFYIWRKQVRRAYHVMPGL